jgi:hypothetical protein
MFESGQLEGLLKKVEDLQKSQKDHISICGITFKKSDLKRAEQDTEEHKEGQRVNVTVVTWEDGTKSTLPISIQQFNEEFYK